MANRYSKALRHLKNKNIDEKLELLEQLPTNNTTGLYVDVPGIFEPEEIGPGDLPPNEGLNLGEDGQGQEGYTGNDTTGLFMADGTIKAVEPPGDTSYILGPMMSMWYAWANYTQIGYVRQSDRKMVNLGRITGEMSAWDGETGFTGYGQLSLEQAVWFKGQTRADYRAFYPGPPSNPADEYGRYIGSLISSSKSTQTITPSVDIPGTNRTFDPTDNLALLMKDRESDKDRSDEILRTVLNAAMLGLDIVAVLAVLFPDPISSAAGAAILGSKLRYVAKFAKAISKFNPFKGSTGLARGLKGSQVGATGLKKAGFEALKGGKNLHKGSKGLLSPGGKGVYSSPKVGQVGPGGLKPGTGASRYTQAGSNPLGGAQGAAGQPGGVVGSITPGGARGIGSIEPQKVVNPKTFQKGQQLFQKIQSGKFPKSSRANQYRQQANKAGFGIGKSNVPSSKLPKQFRKNTKTFSNSYEYETNKILLETINKYLLEAETSGSGLSGGGTDVVDGYVDKVSETSSPEQLEKASDDANNIAKEGGKGLSDADLAKIDKDAEEEAKRVTNIRISNPESMNSEQLFNALDLMYESDPEITIQLLDQYEFLIDTEKLDKEYEKYNKRREYISSEEFARNFSPEYARQYDTAQNLWDNYFSRGLESREATFTRDNVPSWWRGRTPEEGQTFNVYSLVWRDTGIELSTSAYQKLKEWRAAYNKRDSLWNNKIYPEMKRQRELALSEYKTITDPLFRPSLLAMIFGWNQMFGVSPTGDPYSLDEPIPHDVYGELAILGISFLAAKNLQSALGTAKLATLTRTMNGLKKLKRWAKDWWNKGRNIRVPGENTATIKDLRIDDMQQGSKFIKPGSRYKNPKNLTDADFEGGAIPKNLDQLGQLLQGKGGFTWQLTRGLKTGPTALTRQLIERPIRAMMKFFESSNLKGNLLTEETSDQKKLYDSLDAAIKETDIKDFAKVIDTFIKMIGGELDKKKKIGMESHQPKFLKNRERNNLTEIVTPKQKRILRDIKKPVEVKEMPTKFKVKPTGRKNKSVGVDMMNIPDVPKQYKPPMNMWGKHEYKQNVRRSQEKKNEVLELLGAAEHHWTYLTEDRRKQKQEKVNEMMSAEFDKQMELLYEKHRIKESKIDKAISAFKKPTDIKPEYPENPPPQMDPETGMHPKYGKRYKHDKLDPHSAEFMPPTGDPVIDANIKKATNAKEKSRKLKVLLGKGKKINETMTTASLMSTSLPPQDLANYTTDQIVAQDALNNDSLIPPDATATTTSSGGKTWTMNNSPDPGSAGVVAGFNVDLSRMDTISVSVYFTNATIDTDGAHFVIDGPVGSGLQKFIDLSVPGSGSGNANPTITIPPELRIKGAHVAFAFVGQTIDGTRQVGTNAVKITSCFPYRRNPMNVFVSLDSPEATAFMRTDPSMQGLSAEDRRKKLIAMLDAGDEYLLKYLGLIGSKARPSDVTMPDSWEQSALKDITPQQRSEAEKIINRYSKYGDVASAEALVGGVENVAAVVAVIIGALGIGKDAATALYNSITTTNSGNDYSAPPGRTRNLGPGESLSGTQPKELTPQQQADVEAAGNELRDARRALGDLPADATDAQKDMAQERVDKAEKRRQSLRKKHREENKNRKESYKPKGKVLSEKKKFKDLTKKIPGYYDGKPAPLGFPMQEPPKMVNGFHPDLVDGKKIANRFNRLDPASAKAMPPTGNPHIDKKVRAAAKKPK